MIFFLTTARNTWTVNQYLLSPWGRRDIIRIQPLKYERLFEKVTILPGAYIFADIELLSSSQREKAATIWETIEKLGNTVLVNHPLRSFRRYQLLKQLKEKDVNTFDVYRVDEHLDEVKFPAFLRRENDHMGRQTPLIHDKDELAREIKRLKGEGINDREILVTEFAGSPDANGYFRKYSVFLINGEVIPRHVFFSKDWHVKSPDIDEEACLKEEWSYIENNPHEGVLKDIFNAAKIQYGRIDYGLVDGKVQVWEINTNPMILAPKMVKQKARFRVHDLFAIRFRNSLRSLSRSYKGMHANYPGERSLALRELNIVEEKFEKHPTMVRIHWGWMRFKQTLARRMLCLYQWYRNIRDGALKK